MHLKSYLIFCSRQDKVPLYLFQLGLFLSKFNILGLILGLFSRLSTCFETFYILASFQLGTWQPKRTAFVFCTEIHLYYKSRVSGWKGKKKCTYIFSFFIIINFHRSVPSLFGLFLIRFNSRKTKSSHFNSAL